MKKLKCFFPFHLFQCLNKYIPEHATSEPT
jgi:hypothetical protein